MSTAVEKLRGDLSQRIPYELVDNLLNEYIHIKQQFFLGKFRPSELNAARFCECVIRLLQHLQQGIYTPFGVQLHNVDNLLRQIESNTTLPDTLRFFIPRTARVILDLRNKRDVAHVGGEVNPNLSDSLFVVHGSDWILTEIVRHFHSCSIVDAQLVVNSINQVRFPLVAEVDGFVRVQNTTLSASDKVLVILYHRHPVSVSDSDLIRWIRYANSSRFRSDVLAHLDRDALLHYEGGLCVILPKGIAYIEKNVELDMLA